MTYKITNRQCPVSHFNKCLARSSVPSYNTRNCQDLHIPKGFHYSALKSWNDTPAAIPELPTSSSFKKELKYT